MTTMRALTFDRSRETWDGSTGMVLETVPVPEISGVRDRSSVVVEVIHTGFCGSDRGIWWRKAFGDMVLGSLDDEGADKRVFGHELLGRVVDVGPRVGPKYGYQVGDIVSTESHIVCGTCHQCRLGEFHVCNRDRIIGISLDGCFAEHVKLPAKALWRTDLEKIRPEVAAIQEPFGNAMHACQVTDLRGKTVAILGTGTIGLFAVLIARGMGARKVIGIEPDPRHQQLARDLGCDHVISPGTSDPEWAGNPELKQQVLDLTDGIGADVSMEMAGFNSSMNNAVAITRRGGHVVLFGVRNGNLVLQDAHRIVMNGLQLHAVVGRRIFETWHMTRALLENADNGIQNAIWTHILNGGDGTMVHIDDWERDSFEQAIQSQPKIIIDFS